MSAKDMTTMAKHAEKKVQLEAIPTDRFDEEFTKAMRDGHADVIDFLKVTTTNDSDVNKFVLKLIPQLEEHKKIAIRLVPVTIKEAR
jgi:hypothetical protein